MSVPPWFRDSPHRTLAQVRETEHLRKILAVPGYWQTPAGQRDCVRLNWLEARACEPERGEDAA